MPEGDLLAPPICRLCGARLKHSFLDLGLTPIASAFVTPELAASGDEPLYPLHARVCDSCLLVQIDAVVAPEMLLADYTYYSSYSLGWVEQARRFAVAMQARLGLGPASLVIEIASNDGYLLQHFKAAGVPVLGIDPAINVAQAALARGVPTEIAFFDADTAPVIARQRGQADLVVANNVLEHVPDIAGFVGGLPLLLRPEGVASFEFPHLLRLIEGVQFDTIHHENYAYLSLLVVERVLAQAGLRVFDVETLPSQGGSLRVLACHRGASHCEAPGLAAVRAQEAAAGLHRPETYDGFAARVRAVTEAFHDFIAETQDQGRRVAAYGAAAKGSSFLNACGVTQAEILCVADRNPAKRGRLMPGSHIPIVSPDALAAADPDDLLILPWNLREEIAPQLYALRGRGCRIWVAIPGLQTV